MNVTSAAVALFVISAITGVAGCASPSENTAGKPAGRAHHHEAGHSSIDQNADGLVDLEEAARSPALSKQFDRIDTNRDGLLDHEEIALHRKNMMSDHHRNVEERFRVADADGDRGLTLDEAKAGQVIPVVHHFAELDTDKSGKVTMEELKSAGMDSKGHGGHGKKR
jgi:hypothetical protein